MLIALKNCSGIVSVQLINSDKIITCPVESYSANFIITNKIEHEELLPNTYALVYDSKPVYPIFASCNNLRVLKRLMTKLENRLDFNQMPSKTNVVEEKEAKKPYLVDVVIPLIKSHMLTYKQWDATIGHRRLEQFD